MTLRVLSLFSGIGGFDIGLEAAGMQTVAFCEKEPFCQDILAHHWPGVKIYDDVTTLTADTLRRDGITCDLIAAGFPCQDVSHAGKRAGLEGTRSGLWSEVARLGGELRPRFILLENVTGLLSLGMETVLGDLSSIGYDAVWDCIPASAVGARHRRDRIWIIAHDPNARGRGGRADASGYRLPAEQAVVQHQNRKARPDHDQAVRGDVSNPDGLRRERVRIAQHGEQQGARRHQPDGLREGRRGQGEDEYLADTAGGGSPQQGNEGGDGQAPGDRKADQPRGGGAVHVADASVQGLEVGERQRGVPRRAKRAKQGKDAVVGGHELPDADPAMREGRIEHGYAARLSRFADDYWSGPESGLGGSPHGLPDWLDRHIGGGVNGTKGQASAIETLRNVWSTHLSKTLLRAAGGLNRVQQAEILFTFVRQLQAGSKDWDAVVAGAQAPEELLRSLRKHAVSSRPSRRPKPGKQRPDKPSDTMHSLSQLLAYDNEEAWAGGGWEDAIPRTVIGMPGRANRLKALGNAIVPQVAFEIGKAVMAVVDAEHSEQNG